MWAKANAAILAGLLAATGLAGCGAGARFAPALTTRAVPSRTQEQFAEALALLADLRYRAALAKLPALAEEFAAAGDLAKAGECLFWQGYCFEKLSEPAKARQAYQRVRLRYSETPAAAQAARRLRGLGEDREG